MIDHSLLDDMGPFPAGSGALGGRLTAQVAKSPAPSPGPKEPPDRPKLPMELLIVIMDELLRRGWRRSLLCLLLASRSCYLLGLPIAFRELEVGERDSCRKLRLRERHVATLLAGERRGLPRLCHVRTLRLRVDPEEPWHRDLVRRCLPQITRLEVYLEDLHELPPLLGNLEAGRALETLVLDFPSLPHFSRHKWMFGSSAPAFGTLPPSLKHVVVNGFTYLSDFRPLFDLLATKPDQVSSIFLNTTGPTVGNLSAYPQLMTKLKRAVVPLHDLEPLLPALAGVPHLEITHVPTISRPVPGLDSLQLSHLTLRGGEYSCIPFGIPRKLGTLELNSPHPRLRMIRSSDIGRLVLNDCETDCIRQGLPAGLSTLELRHPKPTMKLEDLAKAAEVLRAAAPKKVVIRGIPRSEDAAHWQGRVHEFWFWNGIAEWKQ